MLFQLTIVNSLFLIILISLGTQLLMNFRFFIRVIKTLPRDLKLLYNLAAWYLFIFYTEYKKYTILNYFYNNVKKRPNDIAFVGIDGRTYTFKEFEDESNKLALFFQSQGYKEGDCIGLLMSNKPEFILIWYSLAKLKIITAFLNYNLTGQSIEKCLVSCKSNTLIFDVELSEKVSSLKKDFKLYNYGNSKTVDSAIDILENIKDIQPISVYPKAVMTDIFCYIFTSGSTGLPKPVIVRHSKAFHFCQSIYMANVNKDDVFYTFMPLYHSNTGLVVAGYCFITGYKLVIRKKFSVSKFTQDCIQHKITCFNYVGEVCRYLMNSAPKEEEKQLHFKCILGNGLRECSWESLKTRFNIDHIIEFYGSTEGNSSAINLDNHCGACGYFPIWIIKFLFFSVVKCDEDGELILDKNNHAILCDYNEPGLMIGLINEWFILTRFDGYVSKEETQRKIRKNVFKDGDMYFLTGDIFKLDEYGYLYFYDRVGDTYRWKSENISTTETENFLINSLGNVDVAVYGVTIPGHEGKAGMAAIIDNDKKITPALLNRVISELPTYQKPVFIKIVESFETTSTMKLIKMKMKKNGYNFESNNDVIYVLLQNEGYVQLTPELLTKISENQISF